MYIGVLLMKLLKQRNMSQVRLAESVGLSINYINQICQNRKMPTIDTLEKICSILSVSLSEFFALSESDSESLSLTDVEIEHIRVLRNLSSVERNSVIQLAQNLNSGNTASSALKSGESESA